MNRRARVVAAVAAVLRLTRATPKARKSLSSIKFSKYLKLQLKVQAEVPLVLAPGIKIPVVHTVLVTERKKHIT